MLNLILISCSDHKMPYGQPLQPGTGNGMGNLFTTRVGNILTLPLGNVLTTVLGIVLDIYNVF